MVQSRTGSGKTAAFGIPLVDRIVSAEDKFVQAIVLLPTRELALQVAGELARIAAHSPIDGGAGLRRRAHGPADRAAARGRPDRLRHARAGCSITSGAGTLKLDRVRCVVLDECDEMLSMGFQEDIEAILERTPSRAADAAVLGHGARGHPAAVPAVPARSRAAEAVGGLRRRARDPPRLLRHPGRPAGERAAAGAGVREPGAGHRLLQHPRGDRAGGGVPAPAGLRGRGHLVGPVADRSRAGHGPHARRRASASWWPPTWRRAASTSRRCRTSSTTPSRSRPRCTSTAPGAPDARDATGPPSR